jgi:hypothetical protein
MGGLKHRTPSFLLRLLPLAVVVPLILGMSLPEGSGTAFLKGRSASGRTVFNAELQDISGLFEGGSITIDEHVLEFPAEAEGVQHHSIWDPRNGVFTLSYLRPGMDDLLFFRMWAVPGTFKILSGDRNAGAVYEFEALFEGTEPRPDKGHATPSVRLTCRLEYRI